MSDHTKDIVRCDCGNTYETDISDGMYLCDKCASVEDALDSGGNKMAECDGRCHKHRGDITRVHVTDGLADFGYFNYCQTAIESDRRSGLDVEIVIPEEQHAYDTREKGN